jgi:hypothetical protein
MSLNGFTTSVCFWFVRYYRDQQLDNIQSSSEVMFPELCPLPNLIVA